MGWLRKLGDWVGAAYILTLFALVATTMVGGIGFTFWVCFVQ